jgi:hypothetical protein
MDWRERFGEPEVDVDQGNADNELESEEAIETMRAGISKRLPGEENGSRRKKNEQA